ncbi:YraN family protein [uncultured Bifidobacterium sp.]|uniref:YraN family protein n=1 Tax=uncultured Bifidobacterium sp. TaxID=165187 RepID=UPI0028DCD04D|nr:YraN family protein [uncultured Bifidobacterium sp.]
MQPGSDSSGAILGGCDDSRSIPDRHGGHRPAAVPPLSDPSLTARELGRLGEEHAASWLCDRGWRIVDRNWGTRFGELDIIALDAEKRLVFIEVKTRRSMLQGVPAEAVTPAKRLHLRRAAAQWLTASPRGRIRHHEVRFDVIAIDASGQAPVITHIEGAF